MNSNSTSSRKITNFLLQQAKPKWHTNLYHTFDEKTALGFDDPFNNDTLNSPGIFPNPGILYVLGPLVKMSPSGEYTISSKTNKPYPCIKAPSI